MNVRLIARTTSALTEEDVVNPIKTVGELLAYTARVSNPSNQMNHETAPKLLAYCLRVGHWSVFETASLTMEIVTSRAISQQIIRHRSFTFQEFSLRYAEGAEREVYEARSQDPKNRQNSVDDMDPATKDWFIDAQYQQWERSYAVYQDALKRGVAKEQARFLLPLSTRTTLYMTGSIRSWIHYCDARCAPGVQKEHRDIALRCKEILLAEVPELGEYFASKTVD